MEIPPEPRMSSSWDVQTAAGDPVAAVRIKNLYSVVQAGKDAWDRPNKPQPLLVSAEVRFADPFGTAASADRLGADTVHYGTMSKAILASLAVFDSAAAAGRPAASLRDVLERIWSRLTGQTIDGFLADADAEVGDADAKPFLPDLARVRFLSVTAHLPKASLLGEGVSLTMCSTFKTLYGVTRSELFGLALRLHSLRVPTLVGVNANERQAKQFVVAGVEIDCFDYNPDIYHFLERMVVKAMEESAFDTLEALATHLANSIVTWAKRVDSETWQIRIRLEKPTALPFADCPEVEIRVGVSKPGPDT